VHSINRFYEILFFPPFFPHYRGGILVAFGLGVEWGVFVPLNIFTQLLLCTPALLERSISYFILCLGCARDGVWQSGGILMSFFPSPPSIYHRHKAIFYFLFNPTWMGLISPQRLYPVDRIIPQHFRTSSQYMYNIVKSRVHSGGEMEKEAQGININQWTIPTPEA